jgi:hypothetical protein
MFMSSWNRGYKCPDFPVCLGKHPLFYLERGREGQKNKTKQKTTNNPYLLDFLFQTFIL